MRKCPYCKADIEDTARYCYFCMNDLEQKNIIENKSPFNAKKTIALLSCVFGTIMLTLLLVFIIIFMSPKFSPSLNSDLSNSGALQTQQNNILVGTQGNQKENTTHNQPNADDKKNR